MAAYHEAVERGGRVSVAMQALRLLLGDSDMLAYLAMMAPRLAELHRVLKPTGSIYLHCSSPYRSAPRAQAQGDQAAQQPLRPNDGGAGSAATPPR